MPQDQWTDIEQIVDRFTIDQDDALTAAREASRDAGMPPIDVSPSQGKLLELIARSIGARRILEIGTLGGYSTIWLARALPEGGHLDTLEISAEHAAVAQTNLDRAGVADRVAIHVGPAEGTLRAMLTSTEPYDFVFIDADKPSLPIYLDLVLPMTRSGSLIFADNVIRQGRVANTGSTDPDVVGARQFLEQVGEHPRLDATVIQTVGSKGHDGFCLIRVG